jgi:hypothetical protein
MHSIESGSLQQSMIWLSLFGRTQINSNVLKDKNISLTLYECNFIVKVYQMQVDIDEKHTQ